MTAGKNKEVTKLINADEINTTVFFESVEGHTNYNWNIWENEREQQNPPTFLSHLVAINHESQWPKGMVFKRLCLSASLFFPSGILNPLVFRRKRSGRNPRIFVVFFFLCKVSVTSAILNIQVILAAFLNASSFLLLIFLPIILG